MALHNNVCAATNSWLNVDPDMEKLVQPLFLVAFRISEGVMDFEDVASLF